MWIFIKYGTVLLWFKFVFLQFATEIPAVMTYLSLKIRLYLLFPLEFPANRGLSGGEKMRERRETSAGHRQVLWCPVIRSFGWNQTGFEIPVFRNPGSAPIAHVQIYWLLESLRAHVKTGLPRSRFTWLKCHSLPWDAGACLIGFLPGAGRGLSRLSHFLAAWETSVSREPLEMLAITRMVHGNFPSADVQIVS